MGDDIDDRYRLMNGLDDSQKLFGIRCLNRDKILVWIQAVKKLRHLSDWAPCTVVNLDVLLVAGDTEGSSTNQINRDYKAKLLV